MHNFTTNKEVPSRKPSERHPAGWLIAPKNEGGLALVARKSSALVLLYVIAMKTHITNRSNPNNLKKGQALVAGYRECGLSPKAYMVAAAYLEKCRYVKRFTKKETGENRGTIFEIVNTAIFDVNLGDKGDQGEIKGGTEGDQGEDERPAEPSPNPHEQRTETGFSAVRQEEKKEEPKIDPSLMRVREEQAVELPVGFPDTEEKAVAMCSTCGVPPDFIITTWHTAMGRGGRDAKDVLIRRWANHVKGMHSIATNREAKKSHKSRPEANERVEHIAVRILKI